MEMPNQIAFWLQNVLSSLSEDDLSLNHLTYGNLPMIPPLTEQRWQFSVDMIYRLIKSGLIAIWRYEDCTDQASFFQRLRVLNPYSNRASLLWAGTLVYGTERLELIVKSHFSEGGDCGEQANMSFIEAIEREFADHGVPWTPDALLPIMPDGKAG